MAQVIFSLIILSFFIACGDTFYDEDIKKSTQEKNIKQGGDTFYDEDIKKSTQEKNIKQGGDTFYDEDIKKSTQEKNIKQGGDTFYDEDIKKSTQEKNIKQGGDTFYDEDIKKSTQEKNIKQGGDTFYDEDIKKSTQEKNIKQGASTYDEFVKIYGEDETKYNPKDFDAIIEDDKLILNLLAFYTQNFHKINEASAKEKIQRYVDRSNEVFENSKIKIKLKLLDVLPADEKYNSQNLSIQNALYSFRADENVKNLKSKYKAHFVSLFREFTPRNSACGLGFYLEKNQDIKNTTFNVIDMQDGSKSLGRACGAFTLIHEIGHNFGCAHDKSITSDKGLFAYSHGFRVGSFGTVMSYAFGAKYFSNPNAKDIYGRVLGDENANCTKTIEKTKYFIANQFLQ